MTQEELHSGVASLRDTTKRALRAHETIVDASYTSTASLKGILQRLAQEKVSLTAAVANAEQNSNETVSKVECHCLCLCLCAMVSNMSSAAFINFSDSLLLYFAG